MTGRIIERIQTRIRKDVSRHRSMWKNFLQSIGLLTIALVSALYSSGAAAEGRVIVASGSALLSLLIAVWVAFRFVPRLARSVDWDWIPFLSGYHVTRDGWIFFGALAIVIAAAVNTNNNLLYMVLAALASVLVVSVFLSGLNFRKVTIEVQVPSRCFAGEGFSMTIVVKNFKRIFPTLSVFTETFSGGGKVVLAEGQKPLYFALAKPHGRTTEVRTVTTPRRGRFAIGAVKAVSRFPFGFLMRERSFAATAEGIAYPALLPPEEIGVGVPDSQGLNRRFTRGFGYELYTIRDYVPSDSARSVHWKASAKTASLKTREYAADEERRVALVLDRFGDPTNPADVKAFERMVSRAASLAFYLMRDGVELSLQSDEWQSASGVSEASMESILTYLALVQMSFDAPRPEALDTGVVHLSLRDEAVATLAR